MKKTALMLVLALLAVMLAPAALAANNTCGTNVTWQYISSSRTLMITCNGEEGVMNNYNNSDGAPWYNQRNNIDNVVMTGQMTYIGKYNFVGLKANFSLPDSVKQISTYAFITSTLKTFNMPRLLESIGASSFESCTFDQGIAIPEGVTTIPYRAFYSSKAPSLTLPVTLKTIDNYAFTFLNGPTEIELPEGLESVGSYAFDGCKSLTEITIPATVTTCSDGVFSACSVLEAIHVASDNAVLRDEDGILFDKTGTKLIVYPAGRTSESYAVSSHVKQLGNGAFSGNIHLRSVSLPDGITVLSSGAFTACTGLTHIDLPGKLTTIGKSAFANCPSLTELEIPHGVTELGEQAFSNSGIMRLVVPETVTSFGKYLFMQTSPYLEHPAGLTLSVVAGSAAHDYAKANGIAVEYHAPFGHADLILPADLEIVERSAFEGTDATIVYLPDGVTSIGGRAFAACPNLKHVYIPDSIPEGSIADSAFDDNSGLYLYGSEGGYAQSYAASHDSITFIPLDP